MNKIYAFKTLSSSDLVIDALYEGGTKKNAGDDPISKILGCGNQGGFRYKGNYKGFNFPYIVLYSSFDDSDWPDNIDYQTGVLTYYGDNKSPGHHLLDTNKKGNKILEISFDFLHTKKFDKIKPFFVFSKGVKGRDVIFRGVAVPGVQGFTSIDDLQAVWKFKENSRFQNYKAFFTILDIPVVTRNWITELQSGNFNGKYAPTNYKLFFESGKYVPMASARSIPIKKKNEQLPHTDSEFILLKIVYDYFSTNSVGFEYFAATIVKMILKNVIELDITRPWRDGGRDAIGKLRVGKENSSILIDFAVEAKCYDFRKNSVGVKEVSRLISRIKLREFGVLVTSSYIHYQAYEEVIIDRHPILFITGKDIVETLKENGYGNLKYLSDWLRTEFPIS